MRECSPAKQTANIAALYFKTFICSTQETKHLMEEQPTRGTDISRAQTRGRTKSANATVSKQPDTTPNSKVKVKLFRCFCNVSWRHTWKMESKVYKHYEPRSRLRLSGLFHTSMYSRAGDPGTHLVRGSQDLRVDWTYSRGMSPARTQTNEALLISAKVCTGENFIILLAPAQAPFRLTQSGP
jgi:hypothetical protein